MVDEIELTNVKKINDYITEVVFSTGKVCICLSHGKK